MKLILCGDIVPTEYTTATFDRQDCAELMGDTLPALRAADFAVANLECALTNADTPIRKCGPNLKGRPEFARVLAECGLTHLGMSNNHVMDFGEAAMRETERAIREAGMIPFGAGENDQDSRRAVYLEKDGVRAAILGVCEHEYSYALPHHYGANPFDPFDTMEDISLAKAKADYVIVMYHGGKEQSQFPSPRLRKACRAMVRAGADLILCQHSHCVGCHETYRGGQIVYGTGNFNFVHYLEHPHWHSGLMLRASVDKNGLAVEYLPVVPNERLTGIELAKGERKEAILAGFEARSVTLQDEDAWMKEWRAFCEGVRPNYESAASRFGEQIFPHYLDCEAHLDVWQTLFETWHRTDKT